MENSVKKKVLLLTSTEISEIFVKQYIYEFGAKKAEEVTLKTYESHRIGNLTYEAIKAARFFTCEELLGTMHVIPYFLFAKPETMCMGALAAVIRMETINSRQDPVTLINDYTCENSELCFNIIMKCFGFKYRKNGSFFDKILNTIDALPMPKSFEEEHLDYIKQTNPEEYRRILNDMFGAID